MRRAWIGFVFLATLLFATSAHGLTVLVLAGNNSQAEMPALSKMTKIGSHTFTYVETSDRKLPGLNDADILWIGQGEICENAYFFDAAIENTIKDFVDRGGIVIAIGQDSDGGRPCEDGWLPVPALGIERGGTEQFEITNAPEVGSLFDQPNKVTQAHFDDAWTQPDPSIILLATINGGQDVGIGLIRHGQGAYLLTSLENESAGDVNTNLPIIENLLFYAAELLQSLRTAVDPAGKLATTWATMKADN